MFPLSVGVDLCSAHRRKIFPRLFLAISYAPAFSENCKRFFVADYVSKKRELYLGGPHSDKEARIPATSDKAKGGEQAPFRHSRVFEANQLHDLPGKLVVIRVGTLIRNRLRLCGRGLPEKGGYLAAPASCPRGKSLGQPRESRPPAE